MSKRDNSTTILTAAAFQDHFVRSLGIGFSKTVLNKPASSPHTKPKRHAEAKVDSWRKEQAKVKQTNNPNDKSSSVEEEREVVLDSQPVKPTLAEKFGLVDSPTQRLNEEQWREVKRKSNERNDSKEPCVICKDNFGLQQQVLLSCSHVFHRACLRAFERYSGRKSCPMCRKQSYETRLIYEGATHHKIQSATRIQAAWKGYKVRKWYEKYRENHPPLNPVLKKKYLEKKLNKIVDKIVVASDLHSDTLIREIDANLARNRKVMQHYEMSRTATALAAEEWNRIETKAIDRGDTECAICLTCLLPQKRKPHKAVTILNCSHVFHGQCLKGFEELNVGGQHTCPMCRAHYRKKEFLL